jgi:hypothetical protein
MTSPRRATVHNAQFNASTHECREPYARLQHLTLRIRSAPTRRHRRRRVMEIAAFVMCISVVMGVFQQFDQNSW